MNEYVDADEPRTLTESFCVVCEREIAHDIRDCACNQARSRAAHLCMCHYALVVVDDYQEIAVDLHAAYNSDSGGSPVVPTADIKGYIQTGIMLAMEFPELVAALPRSYRASFEEADSGAMSVLLTRYRELIGRNDRTEEWVKEIATETLEQTWWGFPAGVLCVCTCGHSFGEHPFNNDGWYWECSKCEQCPIGGPHLDWEATAHVLSLAEWYRHMRERAA